MGRVRAVGHGDHDHDHDHDHHHEFIGKVNALIFDHFGDFEGFVLEGYYNGGQAPVLQPRGESK